MATQVVSSFKVSVELTADDVVKRFHAVRGTRRRMRCEVRALGQLAGLEGFPALRRHAPDESVLVLARISGVGLLQCEAPPERFFSSLRELVTQMLARGVARHSLPPRDLIVRPDGRAAIVDFERVTFRWCRWGPIWLIARAITRYHLIRLIAERAPEYLTPAERRRFAWQSRVRNMFRNVINVRRKVRGTKPKRRWEALEPAPASGSVASRDRQVRG